MDEENDAEGASQIKGGSVSSLIYLHGFHTVDGLGCTSPDEPSPIKRLDEDRDITKPMFGFHHQLEDGQECAIMVINNDLYFQLGDRRWKWYGDRIRIRYRVRWLHRFLVMLRIGRRSSANSSVVRSYADVSVRVSCRGRFVYSCVYESSFAFHMSINDMAFDDTDAEMEEWWLYLRRFQRDRKLRDALVSGWKCGRIALN